MIVHGTELQHSLDKMYEDGYSRGNLLGFYCLKDAFSVIKGTTLYIYAPPWTAKTWLKYEILLQLSEFYGWKHGIFDPETGNPSEIYRYLIEMKTGKDYHDAYNNQMSEEERMKAYAWLTQHFYIVDGSQKDFSVLELYNAFNEIEQKFGIKLDTTSIDTFDEINHKHYEFDENGMSDDYITKVLKHVRKDAKSNDRYNILVTHTRDEDLTTDRNSGRKFTTPCSPREIAKGQAWFRKGYAMVGLWRAPKGIESFTTGQPYEGNELFWLPHKQKPMGVASIGNHSEPIMLKMDYKSHRFYETTGGLNRYATNPNNWEFNTQQDEQEDDLPF